MRQGNSAPQFPRRWWHSRTRIDIRPALWSLRNRPEEWHLDNTGHTIIHEPSKHEFWVSNGLCFYGLYSAGCSCTRLRKGNFSFLQKMQFGAAYCNWCAYYDAPLAAARIENINKQFAEHFVR